jgi:GWxTD domain-containing protein
MKKTILIILLICLCLPLTSKEVKISYKDLNGAYRTFYEVMYNISTPDERRVYLQLKTSHDRDLFINIFWDQRDPTPGTDKNEMKEEYLKRFRYVNQHFHIGAGRPGWLTDRGRFYMILGKPANIEPFDNMKEVYPMVVWNYYGKRELGLPTHFTVAFARLHNHTEWKFYNPTSDGPHSLLIQGGQVDTTAYKAIYNIIHKNAPALSSSAFSMVPNELGINFSPPLRTNMIIKTIYNAPIRQVSRSYASNFLKVKGYVGMNVMFKIVEINHQVSLSYYKFFEFPFINISVNPKNISLGQDGDGKYFFNYKLNISLQKQGKTIFKYEKNFDFYFAPDKLDQVRNQGLLIHDSFPVIPGKYKLMVYAENTIGKESSYFEKDITVRDHPDAFSDPLLGYKISESSSNQLEFFSYNLNNKKLFLANRNIFRFKTSPYLNIGIGRLTRETWEEGVVHIKLSGLNERVKFVKEFNIALKGFSYRRNLNVMQKLSEDGLASDYYNLDIELLRKNKKLDRKLVSFTISPNKSLAYPIESFKKSPMSNPFYFYSFIGDQYQNTSRYDKAEDYYNKALRMNPKDCGSLISLLKTMIKQKKYADVLVRIDKQAVDAKYKFDYHYLKGLSYYRLKDYSKARVALLKANDIYDSDTSVLNLLGYCNFYLKDYTEAVKVFEASLKLNPEQSKIKKDLQSLKRNTKK